MHRTREIALRVLSENEGVIRLSDHPQLRHRFQRMLKLGELTRVLPGVVVSTALASHPHALIRALHLWRPNAVFLGRSAAALSWWPSVSLNTLTVATTRIWTPAPAGVTFITTQPPPADVIRRNGVMLHKPEAGALWASSNGDDLLAVEGLRTGIFTPESLRSHAESAGHPRNGAMACAAIRLRSNPWSVWELRLHELLREAGITGWVGNPAIHLRGRRYHPDVAFLLERVTVEVDSELHHSTREDREADMRRHNAFVAAGWRVLHVSPRRLREDPQGIIDEISTLLWRRHRAA